MTTPSLAFARAGDKQNSAAFEDYLGQLLEERDRSGLTEAIRQIDALIVEYVQRFGGFQGFFTRDYVAELTHAAGVEESLRALQQAEQA